MPANLWVIARAAVPVAALGAGKELNQNRVTETQRQGYVERDEQLIVRMRPSPPRLLRWRNERSSGARETRS